MTDIFTSFVGFLVLSAFLYMVYKWYTKSITEKQFQLDTRDAQMAKSEQKVFWVDLGDLVCSFHSLSRVEFVVAQSENACVGVSPVTPRGDALVLTVSSKNLAIARRWVALAHQ